MQSEATGNYPVALRSAHERYLVDAPLRGCLCFPRSFYAWLRSSPRRRWMYLYNAENRPR